MDEPREVTWARAYEDCAIRVHQGDLFAKPRYHRWWKQRSTITTGEFIDRLDVVSRIVSEAGERLPAGARCLAVEP